MTELHTFIARCDAVASQLKLKRSTLSTKLFNDGKRLDELAAGKGDIGIKRLARADAELRVLERRTPATA